MNPSSQSARMRTTFVAILGLAASILVISPLLTSAASAQSRTIYRVEAGGRNRTASPTWTRDSLRNPSRFLVSADVNRTKTRHAIDLSSPSLPKGLPRGLFKTGRITTGKKLRWAFPLTAGRYEVRMYFAETIGTRSKVGARVFDALVEGRVRLNNHDVYAQVGANKAQMKAFTVTSDEMLNVSFDAVVGKPDVKALEIVELLTEPTPDPDPTPDPEPTPDPDPTPGDCNGTVVRPEDNLVSVAASRPAGTTFCLTEGTFRVTSPVIVQNGDRFLGESSEASLVVTSNAQFVFDASGSTGARFSRLDISGATGDQYCMPQCGRGIWPGANTTVSEVSLHHNANQGIGGAEEGLLVENSEIYRNGSPVFAGCCGGGIKSGDSFTIRDSFVHHNVGNGIWCDAGCQRFVVEDNVVTENSRNGIRFEHGAHVTTEVATTGSALISRNTVTGSNTSLNTPGGGIEINSASNVIIENNRLGETAAASGIVARGSRHPMSNISIRDNAMRGDSISGCSEDGVVCLRNY